MGRARDSACNTHMFTYIFSVAIALTQLEHGLCCGQCWCACPTFTIPPTPPAVTGHKSCSLSLSMRKVLAMLSKLSLLVGALVIAGQVLTGVLSNSEFSSCTAPCVPGTEDIMNQKEHGTSNTPVQTNLRFNCDWNTADRICNYNRRYAEYSGYFETTTFLSEIDYSQPMQFYDSNTGKLLFTAPIGRSWLDFLTESKHHGWPSFRDDEVNWDNVRVLADGETVSVDGTHLGHNLPDANGRRYCINLVSVAGNGQESNGRQRRHDL